VGQKMVRSRVARSPRLPALEQPPLLLAHFAQAADTLRLLERAAAVATDVIHHLQLDRARGPHSLCAPSVRQRATRTAQPGCVQNRELFAADIVGTLIDSKQMGSRLDRGGSSARSTIASYMGRPQIPKTELGTGSYRRVCRLRARSLNNARAAAIDRSTAATV